MEIKPIRMMFNAGPDTKDDALASLDEHFRSVAEAMQTAYRERYAGASRGVAPNDAISLLAIVGDFLAVMSRLDHHLPDLQTVEIGIGYWAMRHELPIGMVEPIVNALAAQSNAAESRQETAAVYAMMQGFISHFSPLLQADLERSNPQRPWRLLNLNFAITAIRTGDESLMRYAFDTLNAHLPYDLPGFYEEAQALASRPGFPLGSRGLIEAEFTRWTQAH